MDTAASMSIWSERWRLAALSRDELVRLALTAAMVGVAFILFHLQGNTTDVRAYGQSALLWMIQRWNDAGGDLSHGYLIPFVSLGILWFKRREFTSLPKQQSRAGLAVIVLALLLHWLGAKAQQTRLSLAGLLLLIWGVPFYFHGWPVARLLLFPCAYLAFCIPLNFLDSMTFPLRILVTVAATGLLNGLGIEAQRSGSAIYSTAAGGFNFDVADPCSGLRSLLAMTALTAVYAYLTQKTLVKQWILFLSSIPAIIGNIARITPCWWRKPGQKLASGSTMITRAACFGGDRSHGRCGVLLNLDYRGAWHRWNKDSKPYFVSWASWS